MKTIHIRETRLGERFDKTDLFIAWFDGEAAGSMGSTPDLAVKKLTVNTLRKNYVDPHDPDGGDEEFGA